MDILNEIMSIRLLKSQKLDSSHYKIKKLLERSYVNQYTSTSNMVSMCKPYKKFCLGFNTYDRFFDRYEKIFKDYPDMIAGIAEKPYVYVSTQNNIKTLGQGIIVVDVDFCSDDITIRDLYTQTTMLNFVYEYQKQIKRHCFDIPNKNLTCVVLTKPPYICNRNNKPRLKHGFHLQFIEVSIMGDVKKSIRNWVEKSTGIEIDDCDSKPWLLYGSCKNLNSGKYSVKYCVDFNKNLITIDDYLKTIKIYSHKTNEYYTPNRDNLPRVLSLKSISEKEWCCFEGKVINLTTNKTQLIQQPKPSQEYEKLSFQDELKVCRIAIDTIKSDKSEDYNTWFSIGSALYNVLDGEDEGLELFKVFSEKCPEKYDELVCENLWYNQFKNNNGVYTKGTLMYHYYSDREKLPYGATNVK